MSKPLPVGDTFSDRGNRSSACHASTENTCRDGSLSRKNTDTFTPTEHLEHINAVHTNTTLENENGFKNSTLKSPVDLDNTAQIVITGDERTGGLSHRQVDAEGYQRVLTAQEKREIHDRHHRCIFKHISNQHDEGTGQERSRKNS